MKKLMLIAAAAAMTNAFAITQVYDMRINLKTTECRDITLRANQNPFINVAAGSSVQIAYRALSTTTILGMIWCCDCEYFIDLGHINNAWGTPAAPSHDNFVAADFAARPAVLGLPALPAGAGAGVAAAGPNTWCWYTWATTQSYAPATPQTQISGAEGYIFWDARTRRPWGYSAINKPAATANDPATWTIPARGTADSPMPTLTWNMLQRIGSRAEMVEGVWTLQDRHSGGNMYTLMGAGFGQARTGSVAAGGTGADGRMVAPVAADAATLGYDASIGALHECGEAIVTSMSGNVAGQITQTDSNGGCVFCGSVGCVVFPFCNCALGVAPVRQTAAYGTWTIKYNASLSRRLLGESTIRRCFTFQADTEDMILFLETWALRRL